MSKPRPREAMVAALLLHGYDNAEIAKEMDIKVRTVKAHFGRMYLRHGITDGIKRVKLAVKLYREEILTGGDSDS